MSRRRAYGGANANERATFNFELATARAQRAPLQLHPDVAPQTVHT